MSFLIIQFISLFKNVLSALIVIHMLCYLRNLLIQKIIHEFFLVFIINTNLWIFIHYWHWCFSMCEILIIVFLIDAKIWAFHSWLFMLHLMATRKNGI